MGGSPPRSTRRTPDLPENHQIVAEHLFEGQWSLAPGEDPLRALGMLYGQGWLQQQLARIVRRWPEGVKRPSAARLIEARGPRDVYDVVKVAREKEQQLTPKPGRTKSRDTSGLKTSASTKPERTLAAA